jgi:hypothetical protein
MGAFGILPGEDTVTSTAATATTKTATDDFDPAVSLPDRRLPGRTCGRLEWYVHRLQDDWEQGRLCSVKGFWYWNRGLIPSCPFPPLLLMHPSCTETDTCPSYSSVLQSLYTLLKLRARGSCC